jgi:DNA-binding NarL/FixJ family response regulator
MSEPIRILVVEDQFFFRLALRTTIEARPDMRIVGEADKAPDGIALHRQLHPDVTIMDLRLPGMSGFEAIEAIRHHTPAARILVLSNYEGSEDVHRALEAGAMAYLTKDAAADDLVQAILSVHRGKRYLPASLGALLAERASASQLTDRELDVLRHLARGASNREIADALRIAEKTVKIHVSHILDKLGASDRTQAAVTAIQRGIIHLEGNST